MLRAPHVHQLVGYILAKLSWLRMGMSHQAGEAMTKDRKFVLPDGWKLFCVTDENRQLMTPAVEDWVPIPIPKELGRLKYADSVSHRRGADGVWRWSVNGAESQRTSIARTALAAQPDETAEPSNEKLAAACENHAEWITVPLSACDVLRRAAEILRAGSTSRNADDANRYRYLKSHLGLGWGVKLAGADPHGFSGPTLLDKALDAARGAVEPTRIESCTPQGEAGDRAGPRVSPLSPEKASEQCPGQWKDFYGYVRCRLPAGHDGPHGPSENGSEEQK